MHIPLLLSYAFSIWMLVDAYQRGAEHYWYLIIFFPFGEWVYFFLVKVHDFDGGLFSFGPRCKCDSCRHCVKVYHDGVTCGRTGDPYFLTNVHVGYCTDYQKR